MEGGRGEAGKGRGGCVELQLEHPLEDIGSFQDVEASVQLSPAHRRSLGQVTALP